MIQTKFSVEESQARFLGDHKAYGFKDKSAMLRAAIDHFNQKLEQERIRQSADLYAEIYDGDDELRELTETAATGWPE